MLQKYPNAYGAAPDFALAVQDGFGRAEWAVAAGLALAAAALAIAAVRFRRRVAQRILELKRAEAGLRENEQRFRNFFENAAEGAYESAPGGGFLAVNPAFARMFGYSCPDELLALPAAAVRELYVPQSRREEFMEQISGSELMNGFESEVRHRDGTTFWISESVRAVRDGSGQISHLQGFVSNITAGRRAKTALLESEVRYRTLFEQSPVAIVELDYAGVEEALAGLRAAGVVDLAAHRAAEPDIDGQLFSRVVPKGLNEAAISALRAGSKDELVARIGEVATPEAVEMLAHTISTLWDGGNRAEGEFPLRCLDGSLRRFYWRWWLPPGHGGIAGGRHAQTTLIDVTDMRRTESALRESEQRFRILFELSPVGIAEYDYRATVAWLERVRASGVADLDAWFDAHPTELSAAMFRVPLVGANAAMLRLTGAATLPELVAHEARLFTPEVFAARRVCFLNAWSGRNDCEGEMTMRSLDGSSRRVYFRWRIPEVEGKPYYERAQIAVLDLTEVKATERKLAAERERLSVTLRTMTEGVITTDTMGIVQFINQAACASAGWRELTAVGSRVDEICVLRHDRTGAPVSSPVRAALSGDRATELPPQTQLVRRDGSTCLVEGRCVPMHDLTGRALGAVFVFRDVTERSRLESELLRASKLESVGVLAGGIAHDFNNLLAVVMGNLSIAQLDSTVVARAGKWLKEAEHGALRARDLTQQLLTFAKGGEPVRTTVRLQEIVREAAAFATHGAKVRCEFDLAADLRAADADKGQIGQVVQNLVINASQAMPDGGVVRIVLRNDRIGQGQMPLEPGDYLKISINDTGEGIAPELLPHIFEPYFTTKKEGTGLGLATVYSIVRKHRGHVTVESQPGHGTTFHIWLPAAVEAAPDLGPSRSPFEALGGRILFMDDEDAVRMMATELLHRLGFDVTAVADGGAAVKAFASAKDAGGPFHLVMMDLTVPGAMGGLEAMRAILEIDPAVRGVVSSGYSSDPVMANYRQYGFKAMVPKPYRVDQLAQTLRDVLAMT